MANAVVAKCDALDGAVDGLVQDTNVCQAAFSLTTDVPTCAGARDGTCLSAAQKTAIAPIFSGATTSTGAPVYASFPYDSGLGAAGIAFWEFTAPLVLDSGAVGHIFKVPPAAVAGFNGPAFSLSANEQSQAPARIVASARGAGNAGGVNAERPAGRAAERARPLCPYPQVARYNGSGSLESADSFTCR